MEYLLKYPSLIPKDWQEKDRIYFLGTLEKDGKYIWAKYIHFNKTSLVWSGESANLTHWELGNRDHFTANDAVAVMER